MKRRGGAGLHSISSPDGEVNQAGPVPASTLSATPVAETHCSALDGKRQPTSPCAVNR